MLYDFNSLSTSSSLSTAWFIQITRHFPWTNKFHSIVSAELYFRPFKISCTEANKIYIFIYFSIHFQFRWEIFSFQVFMFVTIYGVRTMLTDINTADSSFVCCLYHFIWKYLQFHHSHYIKSLHDPLFFFLWPYDFQSLREQDGWDWLLN
jgi:hypothetical protein